MRRICQLYSLSNAIRNKMFNYKDTVNNINTNDTRTYGTGRISCKCTNSKHLICHQGHIIKGDLRITVNQKRNTVSKGPNYREPKTKNYGKN